MMDRLPDGLLQPVNADPPDPLIGRLLSGQYRILSLIASGGMGRVYKAEQISPRRVVAIKVLTPSTLTGIHDPSFRERFEREANLLARLKHPNTVTVHVSGQTEDGIYYIVMEYVEGTTLSRRLRGEHKMPPVQALRIARQICRSLREAHRESIVHRDLKPSNILLVFQGEGEEELVKVLDFGVAKMMTEESDLDAPLTRFGMFVGTPEYAAPEAAYGKAEFQSDVYSVGVLLYRMMSGKVPFRGATETVSLLMVVNDPVPLLDPALGLPPRVEALVMKCLQKDLASRYQSMDELIRAIDGCLAELGAEPASLSLPSIAASAPVLHLAATAIELPPAQEMSGTTIAPASLIADPEPASTPAPVSEPQGRRWSLAVAVAAGVLVVGGALLWWQVTSSPVVTSAPSGAVPGAPAPGGAAGGGGLSNISRSIPAAAASATSSTTQTGPATSNASSPASSGTTSGTQAGPATSNASSPASSGTNSATQAGPAISSASPSASSETTSGAQAGPATSNASPSVTGSDVATDGQASAKASAGSTAASHKSRTRSHNPPDSTQAQGPAALEPRSGASSDPAGPTSSSSSANRSSPASSGSSGASSPPGASVPPGQSPPGEKVPEGYKASPY